MKYLPATQSLVLSIMSNNNATAEEGPLVGTGLHVLQYSSIMSRHRFDPIFTFFDGHAITDII